MKGLGIKFENGGATFNFEEKLDSKRLLVQNYLVNTATVRGSNLIFPQKGTDLLRVVNGGTVFDETTATHQANFAATNTLVFENSQQNDLDLTVDRFKLFPKTLNPENLTLTTLFEFSDGTVVGEDEIFRT